MEPRPVLATAELDDPRASVDRNVSRYLSTVAGEHTRFREAIADATRLLPAGDNQLATAAALQVRLAQRFLDAQRSVLAVWADTDAKAARVIETAALEAAMVGLDIGGRVRVDRPEVPDLEPRLVRLLEDWWSETHRAGTDTLARAHAHASQWVEVAHLAATEGEHSSVVTDDSVTADDVQAPDVVRSTEPLDQLPGAVRDAFADGAGGDLDQLLLRLLEAIEDPPAEVVDDDELVPLWAATSVAGEPTDPRGDVSIDRFEQFWGSGRGAVAAVRRRSVVVDAVAPMAVLLVVLMAVLVWIG